jgi:hypothetical protein
MIAITLFCILCGLAWNFPEALFAYVLLLALFIPTVIVCQVLVSLARDRMAVLVASLIGASIGSFLAQPIMGLRWNPTTVWRCIEQLIVPMTISPPLGALIFGGLVLIGDLLSRRYGP